METTAEPRPRSAGRPLLRIPAVAERLDVRLGRAYELAREGRIPGVVRIGRQIRVRPDALESFLENGGTDSLDGDG